jgi:ergothioneine biosynthesis protein EgtB
LWLPFEACPPISDPSRPAEELTDARTPASALPEQYAAVRARTEALCAPLEVEDYGVQPMADASPPKWHLAHTAWFFETFLLVPYAPGYRVFHPGYEYLFNSYYNGVGRPFPRAERGRLSRPTVAEVYAYRRHVDDAMASLLKGADGAVVERTVLGLAHEQQHQELLITDLKYNLGHNPLSPVYAPGRPAPVREAQELRFVGFPGGVNEIGAATGTSFCFDNERPRHRVYLEPYALASRAVTCDEYLAFMEDGGYRTPALWLSDGWSWVTANGIEAPLYWSRRDGVWWEYRLTGEVPAGGAAPVTHVSGYEADAYARWAGHRLPTEAEWETATAGISMEGNFVESGHYHPMPGTPGGETDPAAPVQMFGDVWEWTSSAYAAYPGYAPLPGTLGEYNGKFMSNQLVLRGGSCATPSGHVRATYRNFFYPPDRWQFTGIRLARNAG